MRIYVKVKPNSGRNEIREISSGEFEAKVTAVPEKGRANEALIKLLAKHFGVSQSQVEIVGGKTARKKMVDILK